MKKALALALLVAIAAACDPFVEECNTQEYLPRTRGLINKWWMHGIVNWFMAAAPIINMTIFA